MALIPRIMIAAPASGTGKTTMVCGLLRLLAKRGLTCGAFKVGPDYLDPTFHRKLAGAKTGNLDLFFCDKERVRSLLAAGAKDCDVSILEGVMGYYDGILGQGTRASSYDVARVTQTPTVLVVNARGSSVSIAAQLLGFVKFREDSNVRGVILNQCSEALCKTIAPVIEQECGVHVYGCVPRDPSFALESRHLGLIGADEVADLEAKLDALACTMEKTVDIKGLLNLAKSAPELEAEPWAPVPLTQSHPRIAVAHDAAFSFYYSENLRFLEQLGAELVEFSPLKDKTLPSNACGLYLGGGYPEVYAKELSGNKDMLDCVQKALRAGLPCVAECGGFMYLQHSLADAAGSVYPMASILPGDAQNEGKLRHFGYIQMTAQTDGLLADKGYELRAHEFHYWHSADEGESFAAKKPGRATEWGAGFHTSSLYAGFPHLYWPGDPMPANRFVLACADWAEKRRGLQ